MPIARLCGDRAGQSSGVWLGRVAEQLFQATAVNDGAAVHHYHIDKGVAAFRDRPLVDTTYPYVFLNATYCNSRVGRSIAAIDLVLQGSSWQRCRVHFMCNVLSNALRAAGPMVASIIRTIFAQPHTEHMFTQFHEVVRMLTH